MALGAAVGIALDEFTVPGKAKRGNRQPGFLQYLARDRLFEGLARFDDPARAA